MPIRHTKLNGRIAYTSDQPERMGQVRGREEFSVTIHADGRRTLRTYSEIDDVPNIVRDVVLSVDPSFRPIDCFVRISVADEFRGSSWFHFRDNEATCEGLTTQEGRFSQRYVMAEPIAAFGTHPIQGDTFMMASIPISDGPISVVCRNILLCSLDHRGASGPMLMPPHGGGLPIQFVGREKVEVRAGIFDALHFRITETTEDDTTTRNAPGHHPSSDLWCTADGDYILLRLIVKGYMRTRYELVEYQRYEARP